MEYQETIPMLRSPSNAPINVKRAGGGGGEGRGGEGKLYYSLLKGQKGSLTSFVHLFQQP